MLHGKSDFKPSADFIVSRGFTIAGQDLREGQAFDKNLVASERVLEQLYAQRRIDMIGEGFSSMINADPHSEKSEEETLRTEYQIRYGRKAPANMKIETLRKKVNEET